MRLRRFASACAVPLALVALALAAPGAPLAADDPPTVEPGEEAPTVKDAITVTAQKREESIQDVSQSITAMDSETIELLTVGGADIVTLSGRVPSLQIETSFGRAFPRFYIRGLGNTDFDLNASQPVSMVVDEVVMENPILKGMPMFDLERIEVLRGPQGSLFGRNTPAGVVKFDSVKPSAERDGYVRASVGTLDSLNFEAALGGAIGENLSGRVSVSHQSQGDWVDNRFTGENDALGGHDITAYRLQLLWQPNDRFDALVNFHGWDVDGTARIFRANILKPGEDDLVAGFDQETVFHDGLNEQDISSWGAALKLDYEFDGVTLTSVTGYETLDMYSRGDIDGGNPGGPGFIPFSAESADGLPDLDQFTQEIRLASDTGGRWDWLAGFYYFDESLQADTFNYDSLAPGNPQFGYSYQKQDATSWALFGSLDFRPSDRWTIKGGLRYTTDEKDFVAERPEAWFLNTPTIAPIVRNTDADLVTWDLTATRHVDEDTNVYGRIGTGFRAPSIQGRILFCQEFEGGANPETNCVSIGDEEEILSAEVGIKTELMDRRLRVNAAAYMYKIDDQQITAVGGASNTARLLNVDTTNGYGLEADVQIAPSSNWLVTLGGSYNHTEIDDPGLFVVGCGGGCTILDPTVPGPGPFDAPRALIDGNSLPHAPEVTLNGIVDYRRPIGEGLFGASIDFAYSSEKSFFLYESEEFNSSSMLVGMRLGYTFAEAKYEVALFSTNLLDEEIVQAGIDFNNLTGMTNEPRKVGVEFVVRFGN